MVVQRFPRLVFLVTEDWYFVSHRLALAVAAQKAGYEVIVLTRCGKQKDVIRAAGLKGKPFAMARRGMNPLGLLREILQVMRLYRRLRPDLVHLVALRPVVVGGLAARLAGVKHVVSAIAGLGFAFTGERRWLAGILRVLLRRALSHGMVIVQNPDDVHAVAMLGVAEPRIRLIPGAGVDVQRFSPQPEPQGLPVVILASRLLWDKGVGEFVEAARQLRGRARFVLVGAPDDGNPASVAEEDIAAWQRQGVIEWWGQRDDMPATLNAAHIVCLPSYYREGLPKVLLEAMASGRPCITTDAPGCRDAVRHDDNGLLVPVRDADALALAIARLLDDPELRRRMGARGRQQAVEEFSQERVIEATLAVYREVLA